MEKLANNFTQFLLYHRYISAQQVEWCHYILIDFFMSLISYFLLIPIGAFFVGWSGSILFTFTLRFLRKRTSGYHGKTPSSCFYIAICSQSLFLFFANLITNIFVSIFIFSLSCFSILLLGPANHPELHLTKKELKALTPRIHFRLIIVYLVYILLFLQYPLEANCIAFAVFATAIFLAVAHCESN